MRKTIFVYGSLMEGFWNYQKALEGHVIKKEIGYVQGKLYHMPYKGYPALVPGSDDIQGELLTIDVFEEVEKQLSEIENYYGKNDERNEYEVKSVEVYDIQGKKIIDADVYYYQVERDALFEKEAVYLEKASWRKHLEEIGYIQNLTAADEILIKNYAEKNSVSNLFILGDLHQFGFDKDFQEFYGVKKNNALELLVMRYCNTLCIYGERIILEDILFLKEKIRKHKIKTLNLGEQTFELFEPFAGEFPGKLEKTRIATYQNKGKMKVDVDVEQLEVGDVEEFLNLQEEVFGRRGTEVKQFISELTNGFIFGYLIKIAGEIATTIIVTAVTNSAAMIIGVATKEKYRGRGFATASVYKVASELKKQGITATLFYSNPKAEKIYKKIGFEDYEKYYLLSLDEKVN